MSLESKNSNYVTRMLQVQTFHWELSFLLKKLNELSIFKKGQPLKEQMQQKALSRC